MPTKAKKAAAKKPAKVKKAPVAPVAEEPQVEAPAPEAVETTPAPTPVMFEGASVVEVVEEGDKFHLCKMSDGTTKHVPAELFV
jgi:hypothetical protein